MLRQFLSTLAGITRHRVEVRRRALSTACGSPISHVSLTSERLEQIAVLSISVVPIGLVDQTYSAVRIGESIYFSGATPQHGLNLWRLADGSSTPESIFDMDSSQVSLQPTIYEVVNDKLLFFGNESDPTDPGGSQRLGFFSFSVSSHNLTRLLSPEVSQDFYGFIGAGAGYKYFFKTGSLRQNDGELWRTNGTLEGTSRVAAEFYAVSQAYFPTFEGGLYFIGHKRGDDGQERTGVYRLDLVSNELRDVIGPGDRPWHFRRLVSTSTNLFLIGGVTEEALFVLDPSGSTFTQVVPSGVLSQATAFAEAIPFNGVLYFVASRQNDGSYRRLWRSDGTAAGTYIVFAGDSSGWTHPSNLSVSTNRLFFVSKTDSSSTALWSLDLTTNEFTAIADFNVGGAGGRSDFVTNGVHLVRGSLVFDAYSGQPPRRRIIETDGTLAGSTWNETSVSDAYSGVVGKDRVIYVGGGNSAFAVNFNTPLAAPNKFSFSRIGSSRPSISWKEPGIDLSYEVWLNNRSTNTSRVVNQDVSTASFTPTADLGIGNYTFWARSVWSSDTDRSAWSQAQFFQVTTPVSGVRSIQDPGTGNTGVAWSPLPGAAKYEVWIDRVDVPQSQFFRNANITTTSVAPSLPNGTYRVWVRGIAADGMVANWSTASTIVTLKTPAVVAPAATFDRSAAVSWTSVPGTQTYEVWVNDNQTNRRVLHAPSVNGTNYNFPELPGTSYRIWVRQAGSARWSAPHDLDTRGRSTVTSPSPIAGTTRPVFNWNPVEGATRYELWVDRVGVQTKVVYQNQLTTSTFTPASPLPKGTYRAWVRAFGDTSLTSPWSLSFDFVIADAGETNDIPDSTLESLFCELEDTDFWTRLESPGTKAESVGVDAATRQANEVRSDGAPTEQNGPGEIVLKDTSLLMVPVDHPKKARSESQT